MTSVLSKFLHHLKERHFSAFPNGGSLTKFILLVSDFSKSFVFNKNKLNSGRNKIVKYETKHLGGWRALHTITHSILLNRNTWYVCLMVIWSPTNSYIFVRAKLSSLTVICFMTSAIIYFLGAEKSIGDEDTTARVQLLLTFVLAAYVGLFIARWDRIRHSTFGNMIKNNTSRLCHHNINDIKPTQI